MEIREKLIFHIAKAIGSNETIVNVETSENVKFGDYSTNVAMQLFSKINDSGGEKVKVAEKYLHAKSPRELAEMIVFSLNEDKDLKKSVGNIEIAGPGFINFFIDDAQLIAEIRTVATRKNTYGTSNLLKGKRIMVEYGQPNTHKLPHIGHLYSYIFGESIARLLESQGAEVFRANYQGDVGPHVAKCLWAYLKENPEIPDTLSGKATLLQEMYVEGSTAYESNESARREIDELNSKIYEGSNDIRSIWEETRQWSIDFYKEFEERLGIHYDRYFYESEVFEEGLRIVRENVGTVFRKSKGAIIFEGSKYGLHDRVFITSRGTPTYEAKDMYLQTLKLKEWSFDKAIITTANEQNDYFDVIFKALTLINNNFDGKLEHIGFGLINLKGGKMSSRTGDILGGVELVDAVVDAIAGLMGIRNELDRKRIAEIAEKVGVGAVKYSFLKNNPLQDVKFDINESVSKEGNSGPYLQYTHARAQSVLKNRDAIEFQLGNIKHNINNDETVLLKRLFHYTETVTDAMSKFSPNILSTYLFGLAQEYNTFYNSNRIINTKEGKETENFRLALTFSVSRVLKDGLNLLGIDAPERM